MVFFTMLTVLLLYMAFGTFCLNSFGADTKDHALVTDFTPPIFGNVFADIILILFMSNLVLTYPL